MFENRPRRDRPQVVVEKPTPTIGLDGLENDATSVVVYIDQDKRRGENYIPALPSDVAHKEAEYRAI